MLNRENPPGNAVALAGIAAKGLLIQLRLRWLAGVICTERERSLAVWCGSG